MTRILLFLIGVFIGVYRVDFSNFKGDVVITPILVLTAIFVPYITLKGILIRYKIPHNFFLLIGIIISLSTWLLFFIDYEDPIQFKRTILFGFLLVAAVILNLAIYNVANPRKLILQFIFSSVLVFAVFTLLQYILFINQVFYTMYGGITNFIELRPLSVGTSFPRITGGFWDPNLGGYFLIFCYLLLSMLEKRAGQYLSFKIIISLLIITTLSRSSIVTLSVIILANTLRTSSLYSLLKFKWFARALIITCFLIIAGLSVSFFLSSDTLETIISNRLTTDDRSANIHFALIDLGFEKITENFSTFLTGYGFGSSYIYTSNYAGGSKYGNFHSEFLTIQLETGLIGLLLYLSLIFVPLFRINLFKDNFNFFMALIVFATVMEGIFYQQYLFQYYWFFLLIPWFWHNKEFKEKLLSKNEDSH